MLRYVDPLRRRGPLYRAYAAFSGSPVGRRLSEKVVRRLDPHVLRATRGRLGLGLILPSALLATRSPTACSGRSRPTAAMRRRRTGRSRSSR